MNRTVAHVVREAGVLTEPFIARRVSVPIPAWTPEQWSEVGDPPVDIAGIRVASQLIAPGSTGAKVFHRIPQLGRRQQHVYRALATSRRPDVIHAHYLTTGYLAATGDRPLVISAYGFDVGVMAQRRLWRRALGQLAVKRPVVLVEGPHMRQSVIGLGFAPERVRVVPIAVGHERLAYEPPGPPRSPLRLLIAGRFVEKKGIDTAIRTFAALRSSRPDATLEIVGGGRLEADLRSLATDTGAGQAITFAGLLPRDAYLDRIRGADVLLAPSRTAQNGDTEGGAPTTILDAQAVGTIVVGSSHADIPFLIEDGRTGFVADEGSVDSLVDAVSRAVAAASDRWPDIARAARSQVERRHDDASLASGLADAYSIC